MVKKFNEFELIIIEILKKSNNSIQEYKLIKKLQEKDIIQNFAYNNSQELYKIHFILFNQLYKLRDKLILNKDGILEIQSTRISIKSYRKGKEDIVEIDLLESFYRDMTNLKIDSHELDDLLNQFWKKIYFSNKKKKALEILNLEENIDFELIKKRYKNLVNLHHPDCGGDVKIMQEINEAMNILKHYYRN